MTELGGEYNLVDEDFYSSIKWNKLRDSYIDHHPLCELCLSEGKEIPCKDVHHIKPMSKGGEPFLEDNLIALCNNCHASIHAELGVAITEDLFERLNRFKMTIIDTMNNNPNGTSRQEIISDCNEGEKVELINCIDTKGHYPTACVFRKSGEQIGILDWREVRFRYLAYDLDHDREYDAIISEIIGNLGNYKCFIEVNLGDYKYLPPEYYQQRDAQGIRENELNEAFSSENNNPEKAIYLYRQVMKFLKEFDEICMANGVKTWRISRIPINRLTLVLERNRQYKECLDEITNYENMEDAVGLTKTDEESLLKRKVRIMRKLSNKSN